MRYKEFFEITLAHEYTTHILDYLVLIPNSSSMGVLKKNHFLFRNTESGFKILIPVNDKTENSEIPEVHDTLIFNVFPLSQDVFEFTDFSAITENKTFLFTNQSLDKDNFDLLVSEVLADDRLNGFPPVGQIEINLNRMPIRKDEIAPVYKVKYNSKSVTWKYFFITKETSDSLSVESKDITFQKLDEETLDPVFKALKANFTSSSGIQIHGFESKQPLPCSYSPRKNIQLKKNKIPMINHLPNPEVNDHGIKILRIN